jgi:hypothetical protein
MEGMRWWRCEGFENLWFWRLDYKLWLARSQQSEDSTLNSAQVLDEEIYHGAIITLPLLASR